MSSWYALTDAEPAKETEGCCCCCCVMVCVDVMYGAAFEDGEGCSQRVLRLASTHTHSSWITPTAESLTRFGFPHCVFVLELLCSAE